MFLSAKPHDMLPHRMAELIQFNYLLLHKAIGFDENNLLWIDFDLLPQTINKLLEDTISVQLSKSSQKAKEFVEKYTDWGKQSQYIAAINKELGIKPYKKIIRHF